MSATHIYAGIPANMDIKQKAKIDSWKSCSDFLAGDIEKEVASNVYIRHDWADDTFAVILYTTVIVRYFKDKTFSVRNGGFNTVTTSRRVSQFTPDGYGFFHTKKKLNNEGERLPIKKKR